MRTRRTKVDGRRSTRKCWTLSVSRPPTRKAAGLKKILLEPTPLSTEFPSDPRGSLQLMRDLEGTAVPVLLLVDWGHVLFEPLLKEQADMGIWLTTCLSYIELVPSAHLILKQGGGM